MKITIELECPRWVRLAARVVIPAVALGVAGAAFAVAFRLAVGLLIPDEAAAQIRRSISRAKCKRIGAGNTTPLRNFDRLRHPGATALLRMLPGLSSMTRGFVTPSPFLALIRSP